MSRKTTKAARRLPRAPLPKKVGGAHEDKTRRPWRGRKHKGKPGDE